MHFTGTCEDPPVISYKSRDGLGVFRRLQALSITLKQCNVIIFVCLDNQLTENSTNHPPPVTNRHLLLQNWNCKNSVKEGFCVDETLLFSVYRANNASTMQQTFLCGRIYFKNEFYTWHFNIIA